jgi:hypothetical protein
MRPTALNRTVTTAFRVLPWLLLRVADCLQRQARANLSRIENLQQATIWLDRTTAQLLKAVRALDARFTVSSATNAQTIRVDWN